MILYIKLVLCIFFLMVMVFFESILKNELVLIYSIYFL